MAPLLLIDLDNTLVDREGAFLAWARSKADQWAHGDPRAVAYLVEQDDDGFRPRHELFRVVREQFDLRPSVEELVTDFRRELREALPAVPEEVIDRLRALRADGWKIAVVTNGDQLGQAGKIDHLGLAQHVDACCISGELGVRKPDPRILEIAAARCGAELTDAWMVGDAEADIMAAHRARIPSIWLRRRRNWRRSDLTPGHVADGLLEALSLLGTVP